MTTYKLVIDGTSYDILRDSFSLPALVGAKGKHEQASATLSVRSADLVNTIFSASGALAASITADGTTVFTGVVRPYTSISPKHTDLGDIELEILDNTELLKIYLWSTDDVTSDMTGIVVGGTVYSNKKVFDPDDTSNSLVHLILSEIGCSLTVTGTAISTVVPTFTMKSGSYANELLEDLLYQFQADYTFSADGNIVIKTTALDTASSQTVTNFIGSLDITRDDDSTDGHIVTYRDGGSLSHIMIASGHLKHTTWSPVGGSSITPSSTSKTYTFSHDTVAALCNLASGESIETYTFSNVTLKYAGSSGWSRFDVYDEATYARFSDPGQTTLHVKFSGFWDYYTPGKCYADFEVYADITYVKTADVKLSISGNNPSKYDAIYIYEKTIAQDFLENEAQRTACSNTTYSFKSLEVIAPGAFVTLSEANVSGLDTKVRVLSRTKEDDTGIYDYVCEGADPITIDAPEEVEAETYTSPDPVNIRIAMQEQTSIYAKDLDDTTTSFSTSCFGYALDTLGGTLEWFLNGVSTGITASSITINYADLAWGNNVLGVVCTVGETTYEDAVVIGYYSDSELFKVEYAWSSSSTIPPVDGWTAQPTPRTDEKPYQWMRTSTDDGLTWAYSCITGADGLTVQYEYQYGDDADNPPTGTWYTAAEFPYAYETYNIVWGSTTCLYDGDNMVLAADAVRGTYLWQRISSDGGTTWTYIRLTGEAGADAKYFRLSSTSATFEQNARKDGNQTVDIALETSGYASVSVTKWQVKLGSGGAYADIAGETGTTLSYSLLPYRNSYDTVSFRIVADCDGTSTSAEISFNVLVTTNLDCYWGALASAPTGTATNRPIDGDYYLNTGDNYPYVMSGGSWVLLDAGSDTDWGMKVANILANAGDTLPADSSLYTWCQNLVAKNGFIENLETKKLHINSGGAIYTGGFDANGNNPNGADGAYISENTSKFAGEVELMQDGETVFRTQRKVESGPYTGSNSTGYTEYCTAEDFLDNAPLEGYTTIDGHTISYVGDSYNSIAATEAGDYEKYWYYEYTLSLVSETQTFTAPYNGYLNIGIAPITHVNSMTVTVDGTAVTVAAGFVVKNHAVTKGQTIVVTTNVTAGYGTPTVHLYIHSGIVASQSKLILLTATGMRELYTTGSDVLLITDSNNNTVFDSSNYTKTLYAFDPSLLPIADAEVNESTSSVTVGGTTIAPVSMKHSGGAIIFTDSNDVSLSLYNGMADTYSFVIYCTPATDGVYVSHLFTDNFIGMVAYFYVSENNVPEGWIALNASKKIRETEYPKLFAVLATIGNSYVSLASDTKGNYYTLPDLATYDNSTGEGGYFIRSGVTSLIGKTEMDEIRAITGNMESMGDQLYNEGTYADGVFSVYRASNVTSNTDDFSSGNPSAFRFDANDGTTATNPMADHADGNDIHPYNIRLLPCIYAGE